MGNNLEIRDSAGELVATASLGLACAGYFDHLARKYDPSFNMFGDVATINQRLEPIYKMAEKVAQHDYVVMLLFINKKTTFKPEDLSALEQALKDYPDGFNDGPRRVIAKFLSLLRQHGTLTVEYVNTDVSMTVVRAPAQGHEHEEAAH